MTRRALQLVLLLLLGAGLSATGAAWGMFWLAQGPGPAASGQLTIRGLGKPVQLVRDRLGVPHIAGRSLADAFRGLGVAHAQDRLWQMELLRRTASGELSEIFGSSALERDRLARTLGLRRTAQAELDTLDAETRGLLEAYAQGVNVWLAQLRDAHAPRPFELRWLGRDVADWTPVDTLSVIRLRAWLLTRSLGASLLLDQLVRELGGVASQDFFPEAPVPEESLAGLMRLGRTADLLAGTLGFNGPVGSLGILIGADRTANGAALLANDPHLEFQLPAIFYFAHIDTPELKLAGGTWPGVPLFWMGSNGKIAWGQVALHVSVSDVYDETLHPTQPALYDRAGRWIAAERRVESIALRWGGSEEIEVVTTRHGPLLAAVRPGDPVVRSYALRWTGLEAESGIKPLLALQRAPDWPVFRNALRGLAGPPATFLYADTRGNIGTQVAGWLPVRPIETGLLPVPGRSSYYDWRGFVEFDQLPSSFGTNLGWKVVTTRGDGSALPEPTTWLWSEGRAALRARERLAELRKPSLDDLVALEHERSSGRGLGRLRELLRALGPLEEPAERVRSELLAWDGGTDRDSVGVTLYHVFRQRLAEKLLTERLGDHPGLRELFGPAERFPGVLTDRFLDRVGGSEGAPLLKASLTETWSWLGGRISANPRRWNWGEVHKLRLIHAFETLGGPVLQQVGRGLARGPFPVPGDPDSVWTMYHGDLPTTGLMVGPAARYAVDLSDAEHAQIGLAGGQSGYPGDPHYDDALADWLRGRSRPLWMHPIDVAYHQDGVWELVPADRAAAGADRGR